MVLEGRCDWWLRDCIIVGGGFFSDIVGAKQRVKWDISTRADSGKVSIE